ncbi:ArsR/SmtB family transcription factor [Sulfurirhabdus autotrophica]|nr:metalloregulator ArsR/SmtB family transcription factor [Sulfurirhabdus autotrophica]
MKTIAEFFKLFADPTRCRILHALSQGEFCVCELVDAIQTTQYTVSRHLAGLRKGGWTMERREGTWIYYRLTVDRKELIRDVLSVALKHGLDDGTLAEDSERLARRLSLREAGHCVLGYNQV